jgi:hypothetical protein
MQRWGWNFTALKKITAGFITGAAAMAWAAAVQHYIYKVSLRSRSWLRHNFLNSCADQSVSQLCRHLR